MAQLFYIDKVKDNTAAFAQRVKAIATEIGVNPDWLQAVMFFESRFNTKAVNPYTKATGLIQFMPATAKALGTTTDKLLAMSNVQQLEYVYKYFLPYKDKLRTLGDTYLAVFYPALIGKPNNTQLPAKVQEQNPVFKKYWIDGKLVKESIVNYFIDFFNKKGINPVFPIATILILILLIYIINQ